MKADKLKTIHKKYLVSIGGKFFFRLNVFADHRTPLGGPDLVRWTPFE